MGSIRQLLSIGDLSPLLALYYAPEKDQLVVVSKTSFVYLYKVAPDGKSAEQTKKVNIESLHA